MSEATIAKKIILQRKKIEDEKAILDDLDAQMSVAVDEREQKRLDAAKEAFLSAQARHREKRQALTVANAAEKALKRRWEEGDESVSVEDVRKAELEVQRATGLYNATKKPLSDARAAYDLERSDNLLAQRAIDVFTKHAGRLGIRDHHLTYSKDADFTPALTPAIVFAQTQDTGERDRAVKTGSIKVRVFGDVALNAEKVTDAFKTEGCDVHLDGEVLTFREAVWDLPLLPEPSAHEFQAWAKGAASLWAKSIHDRKIGGSFIGKARVFDVSAGAGTAHFDISEPGRATGKVTIEADLNGEADTAHALATMQEIVNPMTGLQTDFGLVESVKVDVDYRRARVGGYVLRRNPDHTADVMTVDDRRGKEHAFTFSISMEVRYEPLEVGK